ncbi:MAG: Rrf2 family transcriptional regulator [Firmicutes bacterium]|nr:Rrf2 family transcriptional regulator [Bacillota bacterium]
MIGIARHTDYAVRLVLHLACLEPGTCVPISEIAQVRQLPVPFLRRLVAPLVNAGIVGSVRGSQGGLYLTKRPEDISLLDVVKVMEGGVALNHCVDHLEGCPFAHHCPVQEAWHNVTRDLEESMSAVRFDQLARRSHDHEQAHRRQTRVERLTVSEA